MQPCIDIPRFERSSGNRALLALVCQAFLDQLTPWRVSFDKASKTSDHNELRDLLHKMKGCLYAISAHEAAKTFEKAEKLLMTLPLTNWPSESANLLVLMARMEVEASALAGQSNDQTTA